MKIIRSTKCTLKYLTQSKKDKIDIVLKEYGKTVNFFINCFCKELKGIKKKDLLKPVVDLPNTWLSSRLRKVAAREAIDMVKSVEEVFDFNKEQILDSILMLEKRIKKLKKEEDTKVVRRKMNNIHIRIKKKKMKFDMMQPRKPKHKGNRMCVSSTIAELQESKVDEFDAWLYLQSIGNKIRINIPIKFHKHFNSINDLENSERLNSYIITRDSVQFAFEIETGEKKEVKDIIGIDTGINALASTSKRKQFGVDIKECINRIKRCKWGSKGQQKARRALKQRIDEVAKEVVQDTDMIVVEKLKDLSKGTKIKDKLCKSVRSSIGNWNYRYWLERLEQQCQWNRISFRTVLPFNTSIKCFQCGHTDRRNRNGEFFRCQSCEQTDNADMNAALNILERFLTGSYGTCYKSLDLGIAKFS